MNFEVYIPSSEDRERIKPVPDRLKLSGDGIFATLQGEGITAGEPAVFMRLHYCNLSCGIPEGWKCDTDYTWDKTKPEYWQEPYDLSYEDASCAIEDSWKEKFSDNGSRRRLVITGGEPLMQQKKIIGLLDNLQDWEIEIETNGTIMPRQELYSCQFNCSPKLANSGNSQSRRYKPEVIKTINHMPRSQFKFVVSDPLDLDEVEQIAIECELNPRKIIIMPEGQTIEDVEKHASQVKEVVIAKGWVLGKRYHLAWFGNKRRT